MQFDPSLDIEVLSEVYDPSDDSYLLLDVVQVDQGQTFLEMGAGTGLVALHAARAGAKVTAADSNPHAIECIRRNAARNDLRMNVIESDLFHKIPGSFDVIAFNPPYLPEETRSTSWVERAWSGGKEGSEIGVRFVQEAWRHLLPSGRIYLILSSIGGILSVLHAAKEKYVTKMLEERHLFFESIYAYELRVRTSADAE